MNTGCSTYQPNWSRRSFQKGSKSACSEGLNARSPLSGTQSAAAATRSPLLMPKETQIAAEVCRTAACDWCSARKGMVAGVGNSMRWRVEGVDAGKRSELDKRPLLKRCSVVGCLNDHNQNQAVAAEPGRRSRTRPSQQVQGDLLTS